MDRNKAEEIVDAIGEALGVDTGTMSESTFESAVAAVLAASENESVVAKCEGCRDTCIKGPDHGTPHTCDRFPRPA